MATITLGAGNNTSAPNATKVHVVGDDTTGRDTGVVIGYSDGSGGVVTSDASGLSVQGTTTLTGISNTAATTTSVGDAASSTLLLASNANRIGWSITNDSSAVLYLKFGSSASSTSYIARMVQYDRIGQGPLDGLYTGDIYGLWASDAGGNARCTEW